MGNQISNHEATPQCKMGSYPNNPICKCDTEWCSHICSENEATDLCCWHNIRMNRLITISCGCQDWTIVQGDAISRLLARKYYDLESNRPCLASGTLYCCGYCSNSDNYIYECGYMYICPSCKDDHNGVNYNKKRNGYLPILWLLLRSKKSSIEETNHPLVLIPKDIIIYINKLSHYNKEFRGLTPCYSDDNY